VVAESIVGLIPYERGEIKLSSQLLKMGRPDKAFKKGIGYVPEDRYTQGFIGCMSLADNIMLPVLRRLSRWGILSLRRQRNESQKLIKELDIKAASIYQKVGELSGGNQQKSTVARALSSYPKLLVLVEPTAGVDVAAKISILANIRELRDKGLALLLVSDDLEDLEISDRIIVMFKGRVYKEIERGWNPHDIVMAMEGWTPDQHRDVCNEIKE
jgi:simple sugar transport system ATP-binding protein